MPKKPTKATTPIRPPKPVASPTYPGAPTDPVARKEYMRRRNAQISNVDVDEYMRAIAAQDERMASRPSALPKEKP